MTVQKLSDIIVPMNECILNESGRGFTVQTEAPTSANLQETSDFLPRNKATGKALAAEFGGEWRYVPGHGCRGGWSVTADTTAELRRIIDAMELPVTLWLYPGREISAEFRDAPAYRNSGGYYCERVQ